MGKKKLTKGKKTAIIAGCAAAGEAVVGIGALIATPFTGGASTSLGVAMLTKSTKDILIALGVGTIVGGTAGAVGVKIADSKKESQAYADGCNDTSKAYEAKFAEEAAKFAAKEAEWAENEAKRERNSAEKDILLKKCLKYIDDLEKERDALSAENKKLSREKEELLDKLYGIKRKLTVV